MLPRVRWLLKVCISREVPALEEEKFGRDSFLILPHHCFQVLRTSARWTQYNMKIAYPCMAFSKQKINWLKKLAALMTERYPIAQVNPMRVIIHTAFLHRLHRSDFLFCCNLLLPGLSRDNLSMTEMKTTTLKTITRAMGIRIPPTNGHFSKKQLEIEIAIICYIKLNPIWQWYLRLDF